MRYALCATFSLKVCGAALGSPSGINRPDTSTPLTGEGEHEGVSFMLKPALEKFKVNGVSTPDVCKIRRMVATQRSDDVRKPRLAAMREGRCAATQEFVIRLRSG